MVPKSWGKNKNYGWVIDVIEAISTQTRMLSLNATIETSKAQEYGKGFAVVASEVRELARRTQIATQKISKLTYSGVAIVKKAGETLENLVPDIRKTAELVQEISAASKEQSTGARQINTAIVQLDQITQQHSAASEEIAAQAGQLQQTIVFFQTERSELEQAVPSAASKKRDSQKDAEENHKKDHAPQPEKASNGISLNTRKDEDPSDDLDNEFERF